MELLTLDLYILLFPPLDIKYVTLYIWLHIMETFQYKWMPCMALFKSRSVTVISFANFAVELPISKLKIVINFQRIKYLGGKGLG